MPAESLKATSMGLVGKESYGDVQRASDSQTPAASGVRTPREQQVRGGRAAGDMLRQTSANAAVYLWKAAAVRSRKRVSSNTKPA